MHSRLAREHEVHTTGPPPRATTPIDYGPNSEQLQHLAAAKQASATRERLLRQREAIAEQLAAMRAARGASSLAGAPSLSLSLARGAPGDGAQGARERRGSAALRGSEASLQLQSPPPSVPSGAGLSFGGSSARSGAPSLQQRPPVAQQERRGLEGGALVHRGDGGLLSHRSDGGLPTARRVAAALLSPPAHPSPRCATCHRDERDAVLYLCQACLGVAYCSRECQVVAWGAHRADCSRSAAANTQPPSARGGGGGGQLGGGERGRSFVPAGAGGAPQRAAGAAPSPMGRYSHYPDAPPSQRTPAPAPPPLQQRWASGSGAQDPPDDQWDRGKGKSLLQQEPQGELISASNLLSPATGRTADPLSMRAMGMGSPAEAAGGDAAGHRSARGTHRRRRRRRGDDDESSSESGASASDAGSGGEEDGRGRGEGGGMRVREDDTRRRSGRSPRRSADSRSARRAADTLSAFGRALMASLPPQQQQQQLQLQPHQQLLQLQPQQQQQQLMGASHEPQQGGGMLSPGRGVAGDWHMTGGGTSHRHTLGRSVGGTPPAVVSAVAPPPTSRGFSSLDNLMGLADADAAAVVSAATSRPDAASAAAAAAAAGSLLSQNAAFVQRQQQSTAAEDAAIASLLALPRSMLVAPGAAELVKRQLSALSALRDLKLETARVAQEGELLKLQAKLQRCVGR